MHIRISYEMTEMPNEIIPVYPSVFHKTEVRKVPDRLHNQYALVPADKAGDIICYVCKTHYTNYLHLKRTRFQYYM